ncbi:DUF2064 domain-containing protein [Streptomyces polyrhachis]|uniref:DUF2064 domain-containing protein n=1 Tax=Streptomyces polyrhachis TaxID=1282885 RepID=A0ABW2GNW9_9ACTN
MNDLTLLVIAKEPRPGRVKTRLQRGCSPEEAAALARAALADTLATGLAVPAARRVLVLEGAVGDWLPGGYEVVAQEGDALDERIAAAFAGVSGPAVLVGMDTPQFTPELLAPVTRVGAWDAVDAYVGGAVDGGFWALGLAVPDPALVRGVAMSRPDTGELQRRRLYGAGLRVAELAELRDVDTPEDVGLVAGLCQPGSLFAELAGRMVAFSGEGAA